MKTKRIAFVSPCVAALEEFELPAPGAEEVQVRLAVSTVSSGTERANLVGDVNVSIREEDCKEAIFPRYSGYSSSGIVEAVGANVTGLKIGDRVALSWSTHSAHLNIHQSGVHKLPNSLSFEDGALLHISTFPLAALRKCRLEIGEPALVMGLGVLGLLAIPLLKNAGAVPIIAVDPIAEKREKALSIGADYALDPFDPEFAKKAKELTNGGAKVGIEVTGIGAGLDGILDCMAPFGRVALLGCTRNKNFHIDYYKKIHGPGITLVGAHTLARPQQESAPGWWTQKDDVLTTMRLTEMGRLKLSNIIDEVHSPAEAPEIYTRLANEKAFPLVQFDWRKLECEK